MPPARALHVIFCWHMHQPDYRNAEGVYALPWTYLHACKDYADMIAHYEENPLARGVFNCVPILVEQIQDYSDQFASGTFRDPLLMALASNDLKTLRNEDRHHLMEQCFRLDPEHMLNPFPGYRRLHEIYLRMRDDPVELSDYLSIQFVADLLVWYHLAWTGETVRRNSPLVQKLMAKGRGFSPEDRQELLHFLGDLISGLIPRYRALAEAGRIEISTTPYYHPIGPLMLDFAAAREAVPEAPLPASPHYPGGRERARWHIQRAQASHPQQFGIAAQGMWPAEGGVSAAFVQMLGEAQVTWTASGEGVLTHSLLRSDTDVAPRGRAEYLYRSYRLNGQGPALFFRDDALSDTIGFDYKTWFGHDAVTDFVHKLESIWRQTEDQEHPVVSIILDGENAWEYYPYNGYYFLSELYRSLSNHPHIKMCTFSDYVQDHPEAIQNLTDLAAGSWVYGNFSTWIGDGAKNRAWDLLCAAKRDVDQHLDALSPEKQEEITEQLGRCEGSDWFWWFGDYNPADSVRDFDDLFRMNLRKLYILMEISPPEALNEPISHGGGSAESGGTMRRTHTEG
ncbi:glycoside hydrolase family 57 protein [Acidithiobacillus montserratensis]|uniref:Glycoside hydrolase family 57 protein n=1 Tax=Acidithiobacillus montserratensis TaxID=2729135 RepID=A0ACD5HJ36_9PROT|nr:glycoside hydrolase family 57 protein [Acidithiobacillus montserratensis]MBN2680187.1 glycoside hydrolase [Acidithiobacillaceae bacterium]MBU2748762.1 glycoside hydrolase [Acidithiobacillus montserratensis]